MTLLNRARGALIDRAEIDDWLETYFAPTSPTEASVVIRNGQVQNTEKSYKGAPASPSSLHRLPPPLCSYGFTNPRKRSNKSRHQKRPGAMQQLSFFKNSPTSEMEKKSYTYIGRWRREFVHSFQSVTVQHTIGSRCIFVKSGCEKIAIFHKLTNCIDVWRERRNFATS